MTKRSGYARCVPLERGDRLYILSSEPVEVGMPYKQYPAIVEEISYAPRKWWQFWKKKKQLGFIVLWLGVDK